MELKEMIGIIEANGKGVRAYRECARMAREAVKAQEKNAIAFFMLGFAAQRFVEAYDDQPLNREDADAAFEQYSAYVEKLAAAADAGALIEALNDVSLTVLEQQL